ncbi:MAG: hypothetical protein ACK4F9_03860 [Brevinematia bacterium]
MEAEKKETELKEVGVPKFLVEEQNTQTNTNIEELTPKTQITQPDTNIIFEKIQKDTNITKEFEPLSTTFEKPKELNIEEKKVKHKTSHYIKQEKNDYKKTKNYKSNFLKDFKIYFSYRNGKKFVDRSNPGKITTVVYVSKDVWYIDYNFYAIPSKLISRHKSNLRKKYLIGIGRNISVVDNRSQLTVYWSGININKEKLVNGKYHILVTITLKNQTKRTIFRTSKILGKNNPLIVILAD